MNAKYELWLTDDRGQRMGLLEDWSYISYTRAVAQFGSLEFAIPFRPFAERFSPWFAPDWRVEVWRRPSPELALRREDVYLLRKPNVYTRTEDNVQMLRFYGRNGWDLLNRRFVVQRAGSQWAKKTDFADDMMKDIVREQMLYGSVVDEDGVSDNTRAWPQNEFTVQSDASQGPSVSHSFEGKNVLTILKEIKDMTFQKNFVSASDERIFFDVIPVALTASATNSASPLGWSFITKTGLFGADRTSGTVFSQENENIKSPTYSIDHLNEVNAIFVNGNGRGDTQIIQEVVDSTRAGASRWNRCEDILSATNETETIGLTDRGQAELEKGKPVEEIPLIFLDTPGTNRTPRSLYGVDWDLGDKLSVNYARMVFTSEVNLVYISVDENGAESISGRNEVNSA